MDYKILANILKEIMAISHINSIDIGGLEPLLYDLDGKNITHLISVINDLGISVKITTNASLLHMYCKQMESLNIDKIRISLHTINEDFFRKITSSSQLDNVIKSILCAKDKLNIEINTLVFKGYEKYALEVINFAIMNNIPQKLYNLYKNPKYQNEFEEYYMPSSDLYLLLSQNLDFEKTTDIQYDNKRHRTIVESQDNIFTIKNDFNKERSNKYCESCNFKLSCSEQFGEYLRVDPDFTCYPCYLRKDIRFNLLDNNVLYSLKTLLGSINLRLIISRRCNFKCCFPNTSKTWCLKSGGKYQWLTD